MDEEGQTERSAGAHLGAGVKSGMEQRALVQEESSGMAGGGVGGYELWDPWDSRGGRGEHWDSAGKGRKSFWSRMSYLLSSWMFP